MLSQKTLIMLMFVFGALFLFMTTRHNLLPFMKEYAHLLTIRESITPLKVIGNVSLKAQSEENKNTTIAKTKNLPILNGTIVVYLHGEMGNHLSVLAKALVVQRLALKEYGIRAKFTLKHQKGQFHYKWANSRDNIQKCFPRFRMFDFTEANTEEFERLGKEQSQQLKAHNMSELDDGEKNLEESLSLWRRLLETPQLNLTQPPFFKVAHHGWDILDYCLDDIRRFMTFDKEACCRSVPEADESVFHFRNFIKELKRVPEKAKESGFIELSANKTAYELYAHLNPGDKVAITTRFGGKHVDPYVTALKQRGITARVITNQSAVEDFCFLLSAKKELAGTFKSTFVRFAALLGEMERVELYYLNYPGRKRETLWSSANMTDPHFKRMQVKQYNSEEQDRLERENTLLE